MKSKAVLSALAGLFLTYVGPCSAEATAQPNTDPALQKELVIGTKEVPPFAMKDSDGALRRSGNAVESDWWQPTVFRYIGSQ
jgi:hypothetical protein